jgi:hypothetical protein
LRKWRSRLEELWVGSGTFLASAESRTAGKLWVREDSTAVDWEAGGGALDWEDNTLDKELDDARGGRRRARLRGKVRWSARERGAGMICSECVGAVTLAAR